MHQAPIDAPLVRRLIAGQFPHWAHLPVSEVDPQGWDNRTFRLGAQLGVRLPSAERYAGQLEKEHHWLPRLSPSLPVATPLPQAMGAPGDGYPWCWSVNQWIAGEPAATAEIIDRLAFVRALAGVLKALHAIDASDGPAAGAHSFYRGASLAIYDAQVHEAIARLDDAADARAAAAVWQAALTSKWEGPPVWVHGDFALTNLIVDNGKLGGVIDFGCLSVGDPACDLAIRWSFTGPGEAKIFREYLGLDEGAWARARGWRLWKTLIVLTGLVEGPAHERDAAPQMMRRVLSEAP